MKRLLRKYRKWRVDRYFSGGYRTIQFNGKVFAVNGKDPLKYWDLETDEIIKYKKEKDV